MRRGVHYAKERKRELIVLVPEIPVWKLDTVVHITNTTIRQKDRVKNVTQTTIAVRLVIMMKRGLMVIVLRYAVLSSKDAGYVMGHGRVLPVKEATP